jgi:hypothetical protein
MDNFSEGSKLPSLLTSILTYQKTGNYRIRMSGSPNNRFEADALLRRAPLKRDR